MKTYITTHAIVLLHRLVTIPRFVEKRGPLLIFVFSCRIYPSSFAPSRPSQLFRTHPVYPVHEGPDGFAGRRGRNVRACRLHRIYS